jgi:hypothetical protein
LLGAETPQATTLGDVMRLDDLIGREGRTAEGADFPLVYEVAEHRQRLLDIGRGVGAMDLVQVDPVGAQAPEAVLDRLEDPTPRVAAAVAAFTHLEVHLGGEHDLVTAPAQRLAHDLLGLTVGVRVGGVDEVDALVERGVDDAGAVVVVGVTGRVGFRAEHHGPEAVDTHLDTGAAEDAIAHGHVPVVGCLVVIT